jgi:ribosomal protein L30/L7E
MPQGETQKKTVTVVRVGSAIGRRYDQEQTLKGLGLNKRHRGAFSKTPRQCAA